MQGDSFEERTSNHPIWKRLKFWVGMGAGLVGLVASVIGINDAIAKNASPAAAPAPSTSVPSPRGTTGGWGPDRPTFTIQRPADYAVLNSITDHPSLGDERNFFRVIPSAELGSETYNYRDDLKVAPGDLLTFKGFYENSARDSFDTAAPSWIQGARAVVSYDQKPSLKNGIYLDIRADNSSTIWDGVVVHAESLFKLQYVEGSARIYNNSHVVKEGGYKFSFDDLHSNRGIQLGLEKMDGTIKPGYQYAGYIFFEMRVIDAS